MPSEFDPCRRNTESGAGRTLQPLPTGVATGGQVIVRGAPRTLASYEAHGDCGEMHLQDDDGRATVLLWPFDRPVARSVSTSWRLVRPRHWLRAVRAIAAGGCRWPYLRGRAAGARILAYQLAPALAVAAGEHRVLLADEVGLGKTAEAGWIIADRCAAHPDARVLVAVPAGLRLQWAGELRSLFAIEAHVVDLRWMVRRVGDLPPDVSPWGAPGVYIVSLDYLKRPDISAVAARLSWDVLVVDEAHTAAAPTDRHAAIAAIAHRARCVVAITGTPFSGNESAFASLMRLGSAGDAAAPLTFRRSREDVGQGRRSRHRLVRVRITPQEQRFHRVLERYSREVWREAPGVEGRLAVIVLRKRALSSPAAALRSLRRRERLIAEGAGPTAYQLALFEDEQENADEEPSSILAAPGLQDAGRERRWLETLVDAADRAAAQDSKRRFLRRLVTRMRGESAVVFTEFRDTQADLASDYPDALLLHGGLTPRERSDVQERFNERGGLLLATDAASEGLNLQRRCRAVVNYELPWNPARLEQRIGRVDRIGQQRPVHAATLVARDTAEDLVLGNVVRRLAQVARTLGARDRLVCLLDDMRTAGVVIGGEPLPPAAPPLRVASASGTALSACDEAARLGMLDVARRHGARGAVVVSSIRSTARLPPGAWLVFEWILGAPSGYTAGRDAVAIRVAASLSKPARAADARQLARELAARYEHDAVALVRWRMRRVREEVSHAHDTFIDAAIRRETQIAAHSTAPARVQPGLFDDRALKGARAVLDADARVREEAQARSRALERLRALTEHVSLAAVLLAWEARR